ncbi:transferase family protein [Cinnamomum micranthum f. kanehirae]|uniref:Transferase family protein n=1 Tax=Cinnamomum micranthum f. kanehirae TaxID=337451 RepID=A0A443P2Q8_9MAGN|nr:transferase family protein [Cinnamomum micranthum f. kanehirae]
MHQCPELPDCVYPTQPIYIYPKSPTPKHFLYLSNLDDQKFLRFSIKYLYLYKKGVCLETLKSSLSRALVDYYPLAGRLRVSTEGGQKLEVDCNGEGAIFAEAFMDFTAEEFLQISTRPNRSWRKLLYRVEGQSFLSVPPLVVQLVICISTYVAYELLLVDVKSGLNLIGPYPDIRRLSLSLDTFCNVVNMFCNEGQLSLVESVLVSVNQLRMAPRLSTIVRWASSGTVAEMGYAELVLLPNWNITKTGSYRAGTFTEAGMILVHSIFTSTVPEMHLTEIGIYLDVKYYDGNDTIAEMRCAKLKMYQWHYVSLPGWLPNRLEETCTVLEATLRTASLNFKKAASFPLQIGVSPSHLPSSSSSESILGFREFCRRERYWLETPQAMAKSRAKYGIPKDVLIRLNDLENRFDGYDFTNSWMPFYLLIPNSYKIIMGVAELNKILGINLGVHDIEDVYDLSKSSGDGFYHLRVTAKRQCFVNNLEDSNKYTGDDQVSQRKREANRVGWKRNDMWLRAVYGYRGHCNRAAFSLLNYEPRYHSCIKRRTGQPLEGEEQALTLIIVEHRATSGAEASTPPHDSEATDLEQVVEVYTSPSISGKDREEMLRRRFPMVVTDLEARLFGGEAPFASTPPGADPILLSQSLGAAGVPTSTPVTSSNTGVR